jgi:transposase
VVVGIDIGKNSFHIVGHDERGAILLRQKWSRGQIASRFASMPPCLVGMEACVGAHHLSRKLKTLGHDARLMPAKYVRPYSKGQKNDFRDAEAIAEAVQRPTTKFVATKTAATNFCCDTTAREAHAREFKVLFLAAICEAVTRRGTHSAASKFFRIPPERQNRVFQPN